MTKATLTHTLSIDDYDYHMTEKIYKVAHPLLLANDDKVFIPIYRGQLTGQVRQEENQGRIIRRIVAKAKAAHQAALKS